MMNPYNSLRSIIKGGWKYPEVLPLREVIDSLEDAEIAVAFDLGDASESLELQKIADELPLNLPYQTTWIEFYQPVIGEGQARIGMLLHQEDEVVLCHWFELRPEFRLFEIGYINNDGVVFGKCRINNNWVLACAGVVRRFIAALACSNICQTEHRAPRYERRRAERTGEKVFSTWTLHIKQKEQQREQHGDESAESKSRLGPRLHLRRGHIRRCASGVLTWVQPCMVGDPNGGAVSKHYAVESC